MLINLLGIQDIHIIYLTLWNFREVSIIASDAAVRGSLPWSAVQLCLSSIYTIIISNHGHDILHIKGTSQHVGGIYHELGPVPWGAYCFGSTATPALVLAAHSPIRQLLAKVGTGVDL
jgi:hypothetical protein